MEIVGYPNYLIYEDGRIWTKYKNKYMKLFPNNCGYLRTRLSINSKSREFHSHRLVAEHYIPNPDNLPTVDHIDRDKTNNHVSNLRWASRKTQVGNRNMLSTNTSGHTNINFRKDKKLWAFEYKKKTKRNKSKIMCICYKFGFMLRIKAGHFN